MVSMWFHSTYTYTCAYAYKLWVWSHIKNNRNTTNSKNPRSPLNHDCIAALSTLIWFPLFVRCVKQCCSAAECAVGCKIWCAACFWKVLEMPSLLQASPTCGLHGTSLHVFFLLVFLPSTWYVIYLFLFLLCSWIFIQPKSKNFAIPGHIAEDSSHVKCAKCAIPSELDNPTMSKATQIIAKYFRYSC